MIHDNIKNQTGTKEFGYPHIGVRSVLADWEEATHLRHCCSCCCSCSCSNFYLTYLTVIRVSLISANFSGHHLHSRHHLHHLFVTTTHVSTATVNLTHISSHPFHPKSHFLIHRHTLILEIHLWSHSRELQCHDIANNITGDLRITITLVLSHQVNILKE